MNMHLKVIKQKVGTPTMGGVVFISATIIATVLTAKLNNFMLWWIVNFGFISLIGIQDDYSKISKDKNSAGLTARVVIVTVLSAGIVAFGIYHFGHSSELFTPFYKFPLFEMGVIAIVFGCLFIVGASNAVNLTDGLDGLATVPSIMAFLHFLF